MKVLITDYVEDTEFEERILGEDITHTPSEEIEILLVWHEIINKEYIDQFPKLRAVIKYGVGVDNIDISYCNSKEILVCNTPDYGVDEVSDTAIAMIMSSIRAIKQYDTISKNPDLEGWQENTIPQVRRTNTLTLGVLGCGRIGSACVRKAKAIGFNTQIYDPYASTGIEKVLGAERIWDFKEFVSSCDIISIHCPLTKSTRGLIDKEFISLMKENSILVNTARGGIINDLDDFYAPLKEGKIFAVALDVLPNEPPKEGKLVKAWRENNQEIASRIIINPHTAYFSPSSYKEMRIKASQNAKRILQGDRPLNIVIPE